MARGQRWVTDETNTGDDYARNRLRHAALPLLARSTRRRRKIWPAFARKPPGRRLFCPAGGDTAGRGRAAAAPKAPRRARYAREAREASGRWSHCQSRPAHPGNRPPHLTAPVRDAEEKYIRLLAALVRRGSGAVQLTGEIRFRAGEGTFWRKKRRMPARRTPIL